LLGEPVTETDSKVVERRVSMRMTRGTQCKCSSFEVNGLIQVRQNTSLVESVTEIDSKVVERRGSIRITRRTECKCSSFEINGLV